MRKVTITTEYITLGQLLKKLDFIATGGQAKAFLQSEEVRVGGVVETRRGRKLYPGDEVVIRGETIRIKAE
jgi:ribosome-associated protein